MYVCFSLISHPFHPCPVLTLYQHDASTAETCLFLPAKSAQCVVVYSKVLGLGEEDVRAVKQELNPMQGRVLCVTDMKRQIRISITQY